MLQASALDVENNILVKPIDASKQNKYKCPDCNEEAIFCKGEKIPPYFRHKPGVECNRYTRESYEHMEAKALLKEVLIAREQTIIITRKCQRCNENFTMEIEPLDADTEIIDEYSFIFGEYKCRADIACIQSDHTIDVIFEICKTNPTMCEKRPEPWFELDANEIRENIKQGIYHFNCIRNTYKDCTYSYCSNCETSKIYFNQRGAGCGKTYESIQLIKSQQFSCKNTFIYLTKMKSARDVIMNEFIDQFERGQFNNFTIQENNKTGNQYKIIITGNNRIITVLIGTIDSFTYAIRKRKDKNSDFQGQDMFKQIINDICSGNMTIGTNNEIRYAGTNARLASDCLVIIDEGQDLLKEYILAFEKIIDRTGIDTYIIGDKLQSIMEEKNLFTFLENSNSSRLVKNIGENVVKRFHNNKFMPFVNNICNFDNHHLPEITGICNGNCCYNHEDKVTPYVVDYNCPNIFNADEESISKYIDNIIENVKEKVHEYGYLPNNFCFIFPIVNSKNRIISLLFPALQDMWIKLFSCKGTYSELLLANMQKRRDYWKQKIENMENDTAYYRYVFWHSSEQTGTIDLTESENATRILSIHSSKGTGCECVYLLGLSEQILGCFTGGIKNTLVYESLLHVGLTRQKKHLYIGIIRGNDDINKRFGAVIQDDNSTINPSLSSVRKNIHINMISNDYRNDAYFNKYNVYLENDKKTCLDWGHHVIRNSVLKMNAERYLLSNTPNDHLDQKFKTLIDPERSEIEYVQFKEYKKSIGKLDDIIKDNIKNYGSNKKPIKLRIPIIVFAITNKGNTDYDKYRGVVKSYCETIINKLKNRELNFCPIECLIYCHLMEIIQHPYDLSVNIMDIYKIISYYNEAPYDHKECGCKCHEFFTKPGILDAHANIKCSIINHHKAVNKIDTIMNKFINNLPEKTRFKVDTVKQWNTDAFVLKTRIDICTKPSSDGTIYCVKLVSQFNNMNFIKVLSEIAFNKYILLKDQKIKQVKYYIVTLDFYEPIEVDTYPELDKYLADYFNNHGNSMHSKVFNFFKFYCKDLKTGVRDVYKKMTEMYDNTLPEYILKTVEELDKEYKRKKITWENLNNQEWFVDKLKENLEYEVNVIFDMFS